MKRLILLAALVLWACGGTPRKPVKTTGTTAAKSETKKSPVRAQPAVSKQAQSDLERCIGGRERDSYMPLCVVTDRGVMDTEAEYLPGVLACEMGPLTTSQAADGRKPS